MHLCNICEVKIIRTSFLLEEGMASPKQERLLPIGSILSVPAMAVFLVCVEHTLLQHVTISMLVTMTITSVSTVLT